MKYASKLRIRISGAMVIRRILHELLNSVFMSPDAAKLILTWASMIQRCFDQTHAAYENYGGRGITVCRRWIDAPELFAEDMGPRPEGHSLDRIDVNGDYCPDNCRWADGTTQARNKRNTLYVDYNGERLSLMQACENANVRYSVVYARMRKGMTFDEATAKDVPTFKPRRRFSADRLSAASLRDRIRVQDREIARLNSNTKNAIDEALTMQRLSSANKALGASPDALID